MPAVYFYRTLANVNIHLHIIGSWKIYVKWQPSTLKKVSKWLSLACVNAIRKGTWWKMLPNELVKSLAFLGLHVTGRVKHRKSEHTVVCSIVRENLKKFGTEFDVIDRHCLNTVGVKTYSLSFKPIHFMHSDQLNIRHVLLILVSFFAFKTHSISCISSFYCVNV